MTGQLESKHFFRIGDSVRSAEGHFGLVIESSTLYAVIEWDFAAREEIDQFDPRVVVVERLENG